jgi:hypothetical protein
LLSSTHWRSWITSRVIWRSKYLILPTRRAVFKVMAVLGKRRKTTLEVKMIRKKSIKLTKIKYKEEHFLQTFEE